jgi:hypothetical protein
MGLDKQANWQLTATTINCDAVYDEVTILVYKDWTVKCTGHGKYASGKKASRLLRKNSRLLGRELKCEGPECPRVIEYRDRLLAEESQKEIMA